MYKIVLFVLVELVIIVLVVLVFKPKKKEASGICSNLGCNKIAKQLYDGFAFCDEHYLIISGESEKALKFVITENSRRKEQACQD